MTKKIVKSVSRKIFEETQDKTDSRVNQIFWFCAGFVLAIVLILIAFYDAKN